MFALFSSGVQFATMLVASTIRRVYRIFSEEAKRHRLYIALHRVHDTGRVCHLLGISQRTLRRAIHPKEEKMTNDDNGHKQAHKPSKSGLDAFDEAVIKRTALGLMKQNRTVTLRSIVAEAAQAD